MRFYTFLFGIFFSIASINLSAGFAFPHLVYVCDSLSKATAISIAAYNAYKVSRQQESYACNLLRKNQLNAPVENKAEPMCAVVLPKEIRLTEQQKYQERKKILEFMKQEFSTLRDDLECIKELFTTDLFSEELLQQNNDSQNFINDIDDTLCAIDNLASSDQTQEVSLIKEETDEALLNLYKEYVYVDARINTVDQEVAALKNACTEYLSTSAYSCIKRCSNIFKIIEKMEQYAVEKEKIINKISSISAENIRDLEEIFVQKSISFIDVKKEICKSFSSDVTTQKREFFTEAQKNYIKLQSQVFKSTMPIALEDTEDDDNDDKCRCNCGCSCTCGEFHGPYFEKLKRNHSDKVVVKRFGPFYQDPITKLWWAYGQGDHGGPHCKVFKRVANGLEFVFNGDINNGSIIDKQHKGKKGKFIHKDDIIPCGQKKKKNCKHCG